jgi:hypothetical protein
LPAQFQAFQIRGLRFGKLLLAGLNGKIFLRIDNFRLARVAVLRDEIASKARKLVIRYFALATRPEVNHFAGAGKMVGGIIARFLARNHRAHDASSKRRHWLNDRKWHSNLI